MDATWKTVLWRQFGAAIDMLDSAVSACPDELWRVPLWEDEPEVAGLSEFWYLVYHTLFWLDLYLSGSVEGFTPPQPFTLDELDPAGLLPDRVYTKGELQAYLEHGRTKCRVTIEGLTDETAWRLCRLGWGEVSFAELLLDNMRHVQEHAAQLNLILGQKARFDPRWIARTRVGEP